MTEKDSENSSTRINAQKVIVTIDIYTCIWNFIVKDIYYQKLCMHTNVTKNVWGLKREISPNFQDV